jgi:hypothetical protein
MMVPLAPRRSGAGVLGRTRTISITYLRVIARGNRSEAVLAVRNGGNPYLSRRRDCDAGCGVGEAETAHSTQETPAIV